MISNEESNIIDFAKNPILIKNDNNYEILSEKILQKLILEDIENFLDELGNGFTFIKSEYPIKLGNRYNYIDLLLYNIKYKCYVVVELKVTELKKEHTGQIMTYMNYIDKNIKSIEENDTVGIIICKQDNEYVIKYCPDDSLLLENTNWCDIIFSWRVIYVITRVLDDYRCDYSDTLLIKYIKIGSSEFKIKLRKEL